MLTALPVTYAQTLSPTAEGAVTHLLASAVKEDTSFKMVLVSVPPAMSTTAMHAHQLVPPHASPASPATKYPTETALKSLVLMDRSLIKVLWPVPVLSVPTYPMESAMSAQI